MQAEPTTSEAPDNTLRSRAKRDAAIVARYRRGETANAISASIGLTRERVCQILRRKVPAQERRELARLSNIRAGRLRFSTEEARARHRLAMQSRADAWPPERSARLDELRAEGKSFSECAAVLGVSRCAVAGKVFRDRNANG